MELNKGKKAQEQKKEVIHHEIEVTRAKDLDNVVMFDMIVNGVTIYGCSYRILTRKDNGEEFAKIGFPSRQSGDKYYSHAYVKLSEEDIETIEAGIEKLL